MTTASKPKLTVAAVNARFAECFGSDHPIDAHLVAWDGYVRPTDSTHGHVIVLVGTRSSRMHPYVVWRMIMPVDATAWCELGDYCDSMESAATVFESRVKRNVL